ncbi:MAG: PAS domain S-box protein [Betaproteobacteria bacterium]|nr:PAS domain S-box protein [Betaproteobacteria bacterium]
MTGNIHLRQWLILVAALLLLGGALAWNLYHTHESIRTDESERLALQAEIVEKNVVPQLLLANRVIDNIIKALPQWQANKDGFSHADLELQLINDTLIGIRPISIINAEGTVIASSNATLIGQNFKQWEYFQTALKNPDPGIFHISSPFKTVLDTYAISMFRAIRGPRGEFAGIVVVSAVPEYFTTLLDSVRYAEDMRASLIHGDGKLFVVAPSRPDIEGINVAIPGTFFMRHVKSGQKASSMSGRLLTTGEERMVSLRTIQPANLVMDKPLVMNLNRDVERIFAEWHNGTYLQAEIFLVLVFVSTLGLYFYQQKARENQRLILAQATARERSEASFRAILEAAPIPFVLLDERENVSYLNAAFIRIIGYTLDDIQTIADWLPRAYPDPIYRNEAIAIWRAFREKSMNGTVAQDSLEANVTCADGRVRTMMCDLKAILLGSSRVFLVSFYDITERKQAENAVLVSNNLLQATLDAIPDLLFEVDIEGRIFNYHARRNDLLAASPAAFLGKTFSDVLPLDVAQVCLSAIQEAAGHGLSVGKEYRLKLQQGEFWFELSVSLMHQSKGKERHFVVLARDVTESRRLREQLLAFLENSAVVAYMMDENNRYAFISENYLRSFGKTREEIIGKTNHEIWPAEIADAYDRVNQQVLAQEGVVEAIEPGPMNDGSWWLSNKFTFHDAQGKAMLGGLSVNISNRVREEQMRSEKERAHRNTLVREVHHRIKNNLQSVAGLLRRELGKFAESQPRLETAISQVNVIAVIHGLQGAESREATRLHEVVHSICNTVGDLRQCRIELLEPAPEATISRIEIDQEEAVSVALVLNELILNAAKHSPEGTAPQVSLDAAGDVARVVISNAAKIAPSFDIKSGAGISTGLSLVRSLLPEQGAELTYATEPQGWLTATLTLAPPVVAIDVLDRESLH